MNLVRLRSAAIVLPAVFLPAAAQAADARPLRLDDAVQMALSRNEAARIADAQVVVSDAAVEKARVAFLPTIVGVGSDVQRGSATQAQPQNIATASGTLTQPLLNAGAWPLYRQAERLLDAQHATSSEEKRLLSFSAANTFLQCLSVEQVLSAARKRLDTAKASLTDAQARVDAGLNSSNDVTRAQLDVASAQQEVSLDEGSVRRAYVALELVLNAPVQGPLVTPSATLQASQVAAGPLEKLVASAEGRRLDLVAGKHARRAAELFAQEPLLRLVPLVGIAGAVTETSNPGATGRATDETLTATLTWTLYDAGNRYADKHSRDAALDISDLQVSALERQIKGDVSSALASLESSQAAFRAAASAVDASRRSVSETATLYRQGLASALELTDANDSRFVAEVGYASAEFAMAEAYLALRQAMGLDPLGTVLS